MKNKEKKILLLDGMNNFKRCFVAFPTVDTNGEHIGAYRGFILTLANILQEVRPDRCIIIFDGADSTKRRKRLYENYKADRKPMTRKQLNRNVDFNEDIDKSQVKQMLMLLDTLSLLPITIIQENDIEADDAIAYITQKFENDNWNVTIGSTDKDFYHLISDKVSVYNLVKKQLFNYDKFVSTYNHTPRNWLYRRLFVVDGKDDNIDGVKGIGKKTLEKVLPFLSDKTLKFTLDDIKSFVTQKSETLDDKDKNKKHFIKISENFNILERNLQLMDLTLLDFPTRIKLNINRQLNANINLLSIGKLITDLGKYNIKFTHNMYAWIQTSFLKLNMFAKKHNSTKKE